jgi:MSHA biogenesis protein MshJ
VKQQWQAITQRYNAYTLRERAMVGVAVLAGAGFLVYTLALSPHLDAQDKFARQLAQQQQDAAALRASIQEMSSQAGNPDAAMQARLADLRQQMSGIEEKYRAIEHKLVPPHKVAPLLQTMLERNHGLRLVALRTLPPRGLMEAESEVAPAKAPAAGAEPAPRLNPGIYRHAVEITVQGGYRELLAYLAQLERAPQQLYWNKASLRADYPSSTLTLVVFTLSTERTWLSV